jgi:hypothetical protein
MAGGEPGIGVASLAAMRSVALVVMEPGSEWPAWIVSHDVDVVAVRDGQVDAGDPRGTTDLNSSDESPLDPARVVRERLSRFRSPVGLAVLACNAEEDAVGMNRRVAIARALLASVRESGQGQLIIHTAVRSSAGLRRQLVGLTALLREDFAANPASVSLRFGWARRVGDGRPVAARPGRSGALLAGSGLVTA